MSFFAELKRRNVFKVGIAYLIGAWLLLQITDVVLNNIEAPGWVFQAIMLLLAIGLPLSLFFAWAFELTPEGLKKEKDVDRSQSITKKTGRKLDFTIITVLILALSYFVYDKFSVAPPAETIPVTSSAEATPAPAEPSIAVLPFLNMSPDPEQEYFSDGISEELLNLLVRVEGLKVASRTSSFTYKGENRNIPEIAGELKVDHILEGSVRKAGNRVRITAQLIDTSNDRHLWSDSFDRELVDIFAIQEEIANAIVTALQDELGVGQKVQDAPVISVTAATRNLDAYELYLKARGLFVARQDLEISIQLFEQATRLDPGFARAWEGLAAAQWVSTDWLAGDGIDHYSPALEAAEHALSLDPDLSMPHAVLGLSLAAMDGKFIDAITHLDQAVAKDPKNATARLWRGIMYKGLGYMDLAAADFQQCLEIDSGYLNCKQHLAEATLMSGDEAEAIRLFEETIEENFHSTDESFVSHYVRSGQRMAALLMANTTTRNSYAPVKDWIRAIEYPNEDHSAKLARFRKWSEESGQRLEDFHGLPLALGAFELVENNPISAGRYAWHPDAGAFRKTDKFKQFVRDHFMDYWRANGFPAQCRPVSDEDFECD